VEVPPAGVRIHGPNGSGKSSLIEAVGYLALARSCRGARDGDVASEKSSGFAVEGTCRAADAPDPIQIQVEWRPRAKRISLDGAPLARVSELLGALRVVHMDADTLAVVRGSPQDRRRFMDLTLSLGRSDHLRALISYDRILRQRNLLLRRAGRGEAGARPELEVWTMQLATLAAEVGKHREVLVAELSRHLRFLYPELSGDEKHPELGYEPSLPPGEPDRALRDLLEEQDRDIDLGHTSRGPHRDDLLVSLGGRQARRGASFGESKTLSAALVAAQAAYLTARTSDPPVLLLDDLAGELDPARISRLPALVPPETQVWLADPGSTALRSAFTSLESLSMDEIRARAERHPPAPDPPPPAP
jgi:DNA replication and repair protein RecF